MFVFKVGMGVRATVLTLLLLFIASFCDCQSITLEHRMEVVERPGNVGLDIFTALVCKVTPINATVAVRWIFPSGEILNEGISGRFIVDQGVETGVLIVVLTITEQLSYRDAGDYICEAMDQSEPGAQWISATVELQLIVALQALESEVSALTTDSEAVLRCEMTDYVRPDESLQWFRGEQQITDGTRHTIVYENGTPFSAQNGGSGQDPGRVSVLIISDPVITDSGVYTCRIQGTAVFADIQLSIAGAEVVDCGVPPPVENGHFNVSETILESMAHYGCNEDFTLSGTQSRICQADGTWSGTDPVCEAPLNTNNESLGPIIGGAVAGILVAVLVTLGIILATILMRRRRMSTTDLSLELQSKVSNRTSDQAALSQFQHTDPVNYIKSSGNVAYVSSADAIPSSHNEAYGITNVVAFTTTQNEAYGALQSGGRGTNNHDYVINQLNYEEESNQYDYIHN